MASTGLHPLDSSIHKTNEWLSQLALDLGVRDKLVALGALRVVLSTLRQALPVELSAELSAELPLLVRGIYFEGWAPSTERIAQRDLIARIANRLDAAIGAEAAIRATFVLLDAHASRSVASAIRGALDDEVRVLWPVSPSSASRVRASDGGRSDARPSSPAASSRRVK